MLSGGKNHKKLESSSLVLKPAGLLCHAIPAPIAAAFFGGDDYMLTKKKRKSRSSPTLQPAGAVPVAGAVVTRLRLGPK